MERAFGIFHEVIKAGHIGNGEAFNAVEKAAFQDVGLEERPRGIEEQTSEAELPRVTISSAASVV